MTGDNEGDGNPPQFPLAVFGVEPGTSEAVYLQDVEWAGDIVARYRKLRDELANLLSFSGPPDLKRAATVLAMVAFFPPDMPPASLALVWDLLSPQQAQRNNDIVRGLIAATVAVLRSAGMENLQIKLWLDEEIRKRPTLGFQAGNAMRWFFDCNSGKAPVPRGTLDAFRFLRPAPSLSLAEAKELAAKMLDTVVVMKAGPLIRQTPRRQG